MRPRIRYALAAAILIASGGLRLLWEPAITRDYEQAGLLSPPLQIGVREKVGQTAAAVALSGLRSLVSTMCYLKAYDQFVTRRWPDLEKNFDLIVQLSPHNTEYWDIGSWHMYKNAASYYQGESDLNPIRARAERLRWYQTGRSFLERGVRNNPDNARLHVTLAKLYEDSFLFPDDRLAWDQYTQAVALGLDEPGVLRAQFRAMVRSGADNAQAMQILDGLLENRRNRVPTLLCIQFALICQQHQSDPAFNPLDVAVRLFGSEPKALDMLGPYYTAVRERWPQDGVENALRQMESRLNISPDDPRSNIRRRQDAQAALDALNARGEIKEQ